MLSNQLAVSVLNLFFHAFTFQFRGNLSVRSLADVVHKEDFADPNSEYLETLLVAVPK